MKLPRREKRNVIARKFRRSAAPAKEFSIDLALAAPEKARCAARPLMTEPPERGLASHPARLIPVPAKLASSTTRTTRAFVPLRKACLSIRVAAMRNKVKEFINNSKTLQN
jgi:hypothetical protein